MIERLIFKTQALGTDSEINIIRPNDGKIQCLMILLHGNLHTENPGELFSKIPEALDLEALCDKYHIMIAIPFMRNRYYISTEDYDCDLYVARELPDYLKCKYHLSDSIEMILAGVSMGGYGAVLIGARTAGVFSKIISVSGAYIANDVEVGNPEVWGTLTPDSSGLKNSFLYYFLPLSDLGESMDRNALAAIRLFKEQNKMPQLVITCGIKDWLYQRNLDLVKALDDSGINYVFNQIQGGGHDEDCFKIGLWNAMEQFAF